MKCKFNQLLCLFIRYGTLNKLAQHKQHHAMPTFHYLIISVPNWLIMFTDIKSVTCTAYNAHTCHGDAFIPGNHQDILRKPCMSAISLFRVVSSILYFLLAFFALLNELFPELNVV